METLRLYPTTKSTLENMETPKTWDEDNRSVHHITNTCKWHSNHRVATRNLREIEHMKNHTVEGVISSADLKMRLKNAETV